MQVQWAERHRDAYEAVQGLRAQPIAEVVPLRATPTPWAAAYKVRWADPDDSMVVRLVDPGRSSLDDVRTEFALADLLGRRGIGPAVHHQDAERGLLVMDVLEDLSPPAEDARYLRDLASLLVQLHAVQVDGEPRLHVRKRDEARVALGKMLDAVPGLGLYRTAIRQFDALRAALRSLNTPAVLCHNDLNPSNVLYDGARPWLIDFDHVGLGDPLFDVATVIGAMRMSPDQRIAFVHHYLGRSPDGFEEARLELLSCLVLLRYGLDALTHVPLDLEPRMDRWGAPDVGEAFIFDQRPDDPPGWSVFRLSLGFVKAGLARVDQPATRQALARLGLSADVEGASAC